MESFSSLEKGLIKVVSFVKSDHERHDKAKECDDAKDEARPEENVWEVIRPGSYTSSAALRRRASADFWEGIERRSLTEWSTIEIMLNRSQNLKSFIESKLWTCQIKSRPKSLISHWTIWYSVRPILDSVHSITQYRLTDLFGFCLFSLNGYFSWMQDIHISGNQFSSFREGSGALWFVELVPVFRVY